MKQHLFKRITPSHVLICLLMSGVLVMYGQFERSLTGSFNFVSDAQLQDPIPGVDGSGDRNFRFGTGDLKLSMPLFVQTHSVGVHQIPTNALVAVIGFQNKNIETDGLEGAENGDFRALGVTLAYWKNLTPKWSINIVGGGRMAADKIGDTEGEDLNYLGSLYFSRGSGAGWSWGLGATFSQYTGEDLLLPFVQLGWLNSSGTRKFELLFPKISFWWMGQGLSFGIEGELIGDLYNITDTLAPLYDTNGNLVNSGTKIGLAFSEVQLGPKLKYRLASAANFYVSAGVSTARRFEIIALDEMGETLRYAPETPGAGEKLNFDLKEGGFVRAALEIVL